jgi:hypothetical protein
MLDLLPPKWRARLKTTVTDQENPTDVDVSALTSTLIESKVVQTRTDERKKTDTSIEDPSAITLVEHLKTQEAQLGTRTNSLVDEGASLPTIDALTVSSEQNNLGNGKMEQVVVTVASVFDRKALEDKGRGSYVFSATEKFIDNLSIETQSVVSAGTTATPDSLSTTGIGIIEAKASRLDATKVVNEKTTVSGTYVSLNSVEYDRLTGALLPVVQTRVAAGTAGLAIQPDATYATVDAVNPDYSIKTVRSSTALTSRTWKVWEHVSLPPVLTRFDQYEWWTKARLVRYANENPETIYSVTYAAHENPYSVVPAYIAEANYLSELTDYSGEYEVTVVEQWQSTAFVGLSATNFLPKSFSWATPFGKGQVPHCLHAAVRITGTTGTTHPTLAFAVWDYNFVATSPSSLSGVIVLTDTQEPYEGGFRRITKSITI